MKMGNCVSGLYQRWPWIRSAGVDSGRILRFSFEPGSGVTFQFGSSRRLCGHLLSKNMGINYDWIDDCSRSLHRRRILKFELPDPDSDLKILEQERSRSLKKWLRPPLVCTWHGNNSSIRFNQPEEFHSVYASTIPWRIACFKAQFLSQQRQTNEWQTFQRFS